MLSCAGALVTNSSPPVQRASNRSGAVGRGLDHFTHRVRPAWMVERRDDGHHVDRHVDRARKRRNLLGLHQAAGIDPVGEDDDRAAMRDRPAGTSATRRAVCAMASYSDVCP